MNKITKCLLAGTLLLAVLIITCPDKNAHVEAIKEETATVIAEEIHNSMEGEFGKDINVMQKEGIAMMGTAIATSIVNTFLANGLNVNDYFIFSTADMVLLGERRQVSFGILNHVFTFTADEMRKELEKRKEINQKEIENLEQETEKETKV